MITATKEKFRTECLVAALFVREDNSVHTSPVSELSLDLLGVVHQGVRTAKYRGFARVADRRAPWLPSGAEVRNTRQLSLLSAEDLDALAAALEIPEIKPQWLNANALVKGVPDFSSLPRGTRFLLPSGGSILVEDRAAPCRGSGGAVKQFVPGRHRLDFEFVAAAAKLRGLLCTVELGGTLRVGDHLEVMVPAQWIYTLDANPSGSSDQTPP